MGRFRVNAYQARGHVGLVLRRVTEGTVSLSELGLPEVVGELALEPRGLVLVTGPTGSGKTTTLASMVDLINTLREVNIISIEDPIEVLHEDKKAIISQREVRHDTNDFGSALRAAMRQDPDVILVGEMRDAETVRAALAAAETGHLVHVDPAHHRRAGDRSTGWSTSSRRTSRRRSAPRCRSRCAGSSRSGSCAGRTPPGARVVCEVMVNTGRTAEAIVDPANNPPLLDLIADGGYYKMQTFDQHLFDLVRDGVVSYEDACAVATNPQDLTVELRGAGSSAEVAALR